MRHFYFPQPLTMFSFKVMSLLFVSVLLRANTTTGTTPYEIGPGTMTRDYVSATQLSATSYHVIDLPVLAWATATGSQSATVRYKSICIPNPLKNMGTGTGRTFLNRGTGGVLSLVYSPKANPAGASGDIGFSKSCASTSASGTTLVDNVCTGTGCKSQFFASTATFPEWNGADYLTLTLNKNPTSSYRATVEVVVKDIAGE